MSLQSSAHSEGPHQKGAQQINGEDRDPETESAAPSRADSTSELTDKPADNDGESADAEHSSDVLTGLTEEDIEKRRAAIKQAADDELCALNRIYQVVNEAGKCIVMKWRSDPTLERLVLDRITFADFKKMYLNRSVEFLIEKKTRKGTEVRIECRNLADWWLSHPARRQYLGGVTFDPTGRVPASYLNLWRGFAVKPEPGDWSLLRNHIFQIVCGGKADQAEYVLNWLARLFQHPEEAGEVALVLRGKKGTGKSILGAWIARAFNNHGLQITHAEQLVGRFNAHLRDLVVLFADEAFFANNNQHEGVLKGLITERTVVIEGKYQNAIAVRNMLHLILASNSDWVIPASTDERRFAVFDVLDTHIGNRAYFAAIDRQMRHGGLAAMLHELLRRDISRFEVRDVPQNKALRAQKTLSMSSIECWWLTVLTRGYLWRSRHGAPWFSDWHRFYTTELLMNSYLQWCNENRPFDRKSREQLGTFLAELYQPSRPRGAHPVHEIDNPRGEGRQLDDIAIMRKDHVPGYLVGGLVEARTRFIEMRDVDTPWELDPDQ